MRISDWSSDVCSSDLPHDLLYQAGIVAQLGIGAYLLDLGASDDWCRQRIGLFVDKALAIANEAGLYHRRSEEHTSELQSLMRISYAVFCLKTKKETSHN